MLAALGLYVFELATLPFSEIERRHQWKHPRTPRVGRVDAMQFLGRDNEQVTLQGTAVDELQDGQASLLDLQAMADLGESWPLMDGQGNILGTFVIDGIEERGSYLRPDGLPARIDFTIRLLFSGDDD